MRQFVLILIILFHAQLALANADTLQLGYQEFIRMVLDNHPISKQSDLLVESGKESFKASKGVFDPQVNLSYDQKYFNDKNYYQLNSNELKLPTRFGVELKTGFDQNRGEYVNPESTVPNSGLAYAGVSVPLGSGLFIDDKRHDLKQAALYQQATELEQQVIINELVLRATDDYWFWYLNWKTYEIYAEAVVLAETRFKGIKEQFTFGEAPAIDTLEAYIFLQNRKVQLANAQGKFENARAKLANHIWGANLQTIEFKEGVMPEEIAILSETNSKLQFELSQNLDELLNVHPELLLYENKIASLDVKRRLDIEKLKPKLDVNYNFLAEPVNGVSDMAISSNNYKWGFEFRLPLFLREARGKLAVTKIKVDQTELDQMMARRKINNQLDGLNSQLLATREQLTVYKNVVDNYLRLLQGERQKFESGESSVFLVNSRENSLINAEIKLYELFSGLRVLEVKLANAMGNSLLIL